MGFGPPTVTAATDRPNILWITSEDNGPELGCYGDGFATTPNLDRLAALGMRYRHCWSNAPVCAPARTTIVSGRYPTTLGAQHMRSNIRLPAGHRLYPQVLREAGYYCCNRSKEDYNFVGLGPIWDDSSPRAHWRNRAPEQPFFAVVNLTVSHESQIRTRPHQLVHDPRQVPLPPYHPDLPEIRADWAQYYDKVSEMDRQVGQVLAELEQDDLREETIIFYYGDHGTGMPRGKRWLYETGLRVPLIVWVPEKYRTWVGSEYAPESVNERLVSFVDLYPTVLSLVNVVPPEDLPGAAFLGPYTGSAADYLYGFRDRMDERRDMSRAVRDRRYVLIRNYEPQRPQGQYLEYMFQTPTTKLWQAEFLGGRTNAAQSAFWLPKPSEELYDLEEDPFQIQNLIADPGHQTTAARLRQALRDHLLSSRDLGFLPEAEMHLRAAEGTPYEMGQDDRRYPVERIWLTAEMATRPDMASVADLQERVADPDAAIRYWAMVGLLWRGLTSEGEAVQPLIDTAIGLAAADPSPSVRCVAAQMAARMAGREPGPRAAEQRAAALARLVQEAVRVDATYFQALEALQCLVDCQPSAGELSGYWPQLSRLNRPGEPRIDFYLMRLLDVLPRQMNVVVLVSDDQRWDSLGVAGNEIVRTPHLDQLAARGIHFSQARVTTSICMSSRATILTGQYLSKHGIDRFGVPLSTEVFPDTYHGQLKAAGYWTGFVGKYGIGAARPSDFDFLRSYEVKHWHSRGGEQVHVTELNRRDALEFLRDRPADRPFLLSVSFFAPHAEDAAPQQYLPQPWSEPLYHGVEVPPPVLGLPQHLAALPPFLAAAQNEGRARFALRFDSPEKYQQSMIDYYRLITEVDAAVGDVVAELKNQGALENTLIVFIGDNGYFHGDRGLADKWYPYEQALRVPLIVFDPRLDLDRRGLRRDQRVLNLDVAPTVIGAAGLPPVPAMQGQDLSPLYLAPSPPAWREVFLYEHPTIRSRDFIPASRAVVAPDYKYVQWPEWDYEQFFDQGQDPEEVENLADRPEAKERIAAARRALADLLRMAQESRGNSF